MTDEPSGPDLAAELGDLRARLAESEEVLRAIRSGNVDAVRVSGEHGAQIYTLSGADRAYRQLVETMSEGAGTLSADGVILYCNDRLAQMLERPLDEVMGSALRNYLPPADQQALDAILAQARTEPSRREVSLQSRAGRAVPVYLSASRLQSEGAETVFCLVLTDLTEQKSHEQIAAAERLARLILEQAAEAIVVCDEQGRVIRASQAAEQYCDGSPLLRPFAEVFPLRTDAADPFHLAPVLQGETLRNVDVALDRHGQELDLILNAGPLFSGQQILGCVVTLTNITEHKKTEAALHESDERYRALFDRSLDLVYIHDFEGRFLDANDAALSLLGYKREEIHSLSFASLLSADQVPLALDTIREIRETGAQKALTEYRLRLRNGNHVFVETQGSAIVSNGSPVAIQSIARDITQRKRAEERVVHLNRILRAVRDINQLIVGERDRQRLIESVCKLLVEGRGYWSAIVVLTDEAGVPRAFTEAGMGDAFQPLAESLRRGVLPPCCRLAQRHQGVYHVTDRDGACSSCALGAPPTGTHASCIQLRHGEAAYGYLTVSVDRMLGGDPEEESLLAEVAGDVAFALHGIERGEAMTQVESERDRVEGELRQSQKMEAVGRLAGGVAHDFNNILTVINASCSFLEEGLQASEPLLEDVRTIGEASQSAARLTRQLLAFSRRQVLEPRPLDLNVLVGESEKMLNRLLGEDIRIRVEAAPALGLVLADPGQFEQVIVNLAVNARDAMPDGGTLTITTANVELDEAFVSLHAGSSAGPFVRLTVTDTGVGMDAETLARVFEPFFTTKEVGRGTGLGLSTVYGIVKQSGGVITVDSERGRGTTFEIFLPRMASAGQPWQPPSEAGSSRGRGETVLLVEDNDQLRAVAARALGKLGYRVFSAAGLDEARRIAATEAPIHLLLTDVVMPGGSGRDVSTAVAAAHPAAKVLYMSGFTDDAIAHRGVLDPGVAFLHKPFTQDSLGRKVREVLDG